MARLPHKVMCRQEQARLLVGLPAICSQPLLVRLPVQIYVVMQLALHPCPRALAVSMMHVAS